MSPTTLVLGPFSVDPADPIQPVAQRVVARFLPQQIQDKFGPGEVGLQSTRRPNTAPPWAWGLTYTRPFAPHQRCWVNLDEPKVSEFYSTVHELGHVFDDLYLTPEVRAQIEAKMLNYETGQGWKDGHYDEHFCTVPREGFADSFAKMCGFAEVLPRFYKVRIQPEDFSWLMPLLVGLKRK